MKSCPGFAPAVSMPALPSMSPVIIGVPASSPRLAAASAVIRPAIQLASSTSGSSETLTPIPAHSSSLQPSSVSVR